MFHMKSMRITVLLEYNNIFRKQNILLRTYAISFDKMNHEICDPGHISKPVIIYFLF